MGNPLERFDVSHLWSEEDLPGQSQLPELIATVQEELDNIDGKVVEPAPTDQAELLDEDTLRLREQRLREQRLDRWVHERAFSYSAVTQSAEQLHAILDQLEDRPAPLRQRSEMDDEARPSDQKPLDSTDVVAKRMTKLVEHFQDFADDLHGVVSWLEQRHDRLDRTEAQTEDGRRRSSAKRLSLTASGQRGFNARGWSIEEEVAARTDAQQVLEAVEFVDIEMMATLSRFCAKLSAFASAKSAMPSFPDRTKSRFSLGTSTSTITDDQKVSELRETIANLKLQLQRSGDDGNGDDKDGLGNSEEAQVLRLLEASTENRARITALQEEAIKLEQQKAPLVTKLEELREQVEFTRHKQSMLQEEVASYQHERRQLLAKFEAEWRQEEIEAAACSDESTLLLKAKAALHADISRGCEPVHRIEGSLEEIVAQLSSHNNTLRSRMRAVAQEFDFILDSGYMNNMEHGSKEHTAMLRAGGIANGVLKMVPLESVLAKLNKADERASKRGRTANPNGGAATPVQLAALVSKPVPNWPSERQFTMLDTELETVSGLLSQLRAAFPPEPPEIGHCSPFRFCPVAASASDRVRFLDEKAPNGLMMYTVQSDNAPSDDELEGLGRRLRRAEARLGALLEQLARLQDEASPSAFPASASYSRSKSELLEQDMTGVAEGNGSKQDSQSGVHRSPKPPRPVTQQPSTSGKKKAKKGELQQREPEDGDDTIESQSLRSDQTGPRQATETAVNPLAVTQEASSPSLEQVFEAFNKRRVNTERMHEVFDQKLQHLEVLLQAYEASKAQREHLAANVLMKNENEAFPPIALKDAEGPGQEVECSSSTSAVGTSPLRRGEAELNHRPSHGSNALPHRSSTGGMGKSDAVVASDISQPKPAITYWDLYEAKQMFVQLRTQAMRMNDESVRLQETLDQLLATKQALRKGITPSAAQGNYPVHSPEMQPEEGDYAHALDATIAKLKLEMARRKAVAQEYDAKIAAFRSLWTVGAQQIEEAKQHDKFGNKISSSAGREFTMPPKQLSVMSMQADNPEENLEEREFLASLRGLGNTVRAKMLLKKYHRQLTQGNHDGADKEESPAAQDTS
ncbi:hypothetical protein AB1Y20_012141 [Prymnesium parvum]|uniref:Uncharacterized protein n=1 Tax=Prymnesium parvum TaxID=97485 RepID=A0AB34IQX7_PRYPA